MNAVAKSEPIADSAEVIPMTEAGSLMAVISRAASDPAVDVDKLERLMGLYERITDRSSERAYDEAMNACQAAMRPIATDANNPQTKSKYATYAALDKALRPIYTEHGFSVAFSTADGAPPEHIRLVARVAHKEGHREQPHLDMPSDGKGAKGGDVMTKTHAIGAAVTYGRRYLLGMIFNIAVGEDDDGNSNGGRDRSAGFTAAVAAINGCGNLDDLKDWKTKNIAGLNALPTAEADEVVQLWNDRSRKLRGDGK